jgi:uncharacterized protein (DUF1800 family)
MSPKDKARHFHNRLGFGWDFPSYRNFSGYFDPRAEIDSAIQARPPQAMNLALKTDPREFKRMSKEARRMAMKDDRERILALNNTWVKAMSSGENPIREKMAFFWHDHFACRPRFSYMAESYINLLRQEALGSFRKLVHGIAREPAMLLYLNNQQNRKSQPNENFARELMELFTLGIGQYTEADIKEAAKAFTGWGIGIDGKFMLRRAQHDYGEKIFFGEKRNWSGEEIIDRILEERQTARHITLKLATYLMGIPPDTALIDYWSKRFYESDYAIATLLRDIAKDEAFYDERLIGNDVWSPVELLVRMERDMGLQFENEFGRLIVQRSLGQILLQPPNVSGWPSGKAWIDASTLPVRMQIPRVVLLQSEFSGSTGRVFAKGEDLAELLSKNQTPRLAVSSDLSLLSREWGDESFQSQVTKIANWLFPKKYLEMNPLLSTIESLHLNGLNQAFAFLASTPEYQLK